MDPEQWLDQYGDALFRFALMRVRDSALAEDLVQETLVAAIQSQASYRGQSSEKTWLIGILKHKVMDCFRKKSRGEAVSTDVLDTDSPEMFDDQGAWRVTIDEWSKPDRALERREFWQSFEECVDRLPERLAVPFVLREVDGLDTAELCETLNVSKSNLWAILSRARQHLRECLNKTWFEKANDLSC